MRGQESNVQSNISATTAAFELKGGYYNLDAIATWGGGSATLQRLGPDQSTWLTAATAITANGSAQVYLCPAQYRWAIVTATAAYLSVVRIPSD